MLDEQTTIFLTLVAIALAGCLTSVEYLYAIKRGGLGSSSLFTWDLCGSRQGWLFRGLPSRLINWCFRPTIFVALMIARIVACIALVVLVDRAMLAGVTFFLTVTALLLSIRHGHGHDGADQMMLIVLVGAFTYFLFDQNSPWRWAGILFIGGQAALSYFVSGSAKLTSKEWRSGRALPNVLTTAIYGTPSIGRALRKYPALCAFFTWALMLWQVSTPVVLFLPVPFLWGWMTIGFTFHATAAILMGLNSFFIAFTGTYPALLLSTGFLRPN